MTVVTDTSVVLNLCYLRQEELLSALCGRIIAPVEVRAEFHRLAASDARFTGLVFPTCIEVRSCTRTAPVLSGHHTLHPGEIAALSLAVELSADAVLMDERAGRKVAAILGVVCIGLLGLLVQGKNAGLIASLAPLLDTLEQGARFRLAPTLRSQILRLAGELA